MSFSFQVRGATVAIALAAVSAEMAKVVEAQPIHKHDAEAVNAAAEAYAGLLPDDAERDVVIACNGYLSWEGPEAEPKFVGVNVGVNARLIDRE